MARHPRRRLLQHQRERLLRPRKTHHRARVQPEDGNRDPDGRGQREGSAKGGEARRDAKDSRDEAGDGGDGGEEDCDAGCREEAGDAEGGKGVLVDVGAEESCSISTGKRAIEL